MKPVTGAWRAFSIAKQANISTAAAVDSRVPLFGDLAEVEPDQHYFNDDEVGRMLPSASRILTNKLAFKHKSKAFPHLVGLFGSLALGTDVPTQVAQTDAYAHKMSADKTIIELPYRTMIENDGDAQWKHKGITCAGFTLSGKRGEFVELEADLIGSGDEATDATAAPAASTESYLSFADVGFGVGGAFANDAVTGGTSHAGRLQEFTFGFKTGAKALYLMGTAGGVAGQIRRGGKWEVECKAKVELEDRDARTALLAGTPLVVEIPLIGGVADDTAHYEVKIVLPMTKYKVVKKSHADGLLIADVEFQAMEDGTNAPVILYVTNLQTASYLGIPA